MEAMKGRKWDISGGGCNGEEHIDGEKIGILGFSFFYTTQAEDIEWERTSFVISCQ